MGSNRYELFFMDSFLPNFPIIKGWNGYKDNKDK